ncbi:hypothetical protein TRFO_14010 [Tritrichomonas foetus]|uniref:Uncharacterized protein n=1 Tax=Tritrichomonas foetus TaxID=1144522 RepID=A0A1J4KWM5_9EUKA|nr:hypothetical protein TRFO_14010 [Tritrichomonas foetus]|eukprot:OHT15639.1 hypothetical protein TRFO_14010 [Tritrichomonas foetus]
MSVISFIANRDRADLPKAASSEEVENIIKSTKNFFDNKYNITRCDIKPCQFFSENDFNFMNEQFSSAGSSSAHVFDPNLIHASISPLNDLSDVWNLLNDSLKYKSIDLFKKCCVDNNIITIKKSSMNSEIKASMNSILNLLNSPENFSGFYPEVNSFRNKVKLDTQKLSSSTSFFVTPYYAFIGLENGEVGMNKVEFTSIVSSIDPIRNLFSPFSKAGHDKNDRKHHQYSLVVLNNIILQIFHKTIRYIELNKDYDTIKTRKTEFLKFPAISDGNKIFSFDHKKIINVFNCDNITNLSERPEKSIVLSQIPTNFDVSSTILATNGAVITFGSISKVTKNIEYIFETFSLVNGKLLKKFTMKLENKIEAWNFSPFKVNHFTIEDNYFKELKSVASIPRWIEGFYLTHDKNEKSEKVDKNEKNATNPFLDAFEVSVFEGFSFFSGGDMSLYQKVFCHVFNLGNIHLIKAISNLFIQYSIDVDEVIELLDSSYQKCKKNDIEQLMFFLYLNSIPKAVKEISSRNYVNQYLENEKWINSKSYSSILLFPSLFNFETIPLSDNAIYNLVNYILSKHEEFPYESTMILSSYCHKYCKEIFTRPKDGFPVIKSTVTLIFKYVAGSLKKIQRKKLTENDFCSSIIFKLWGFFLSIIAHSQPTWIYYAPDFLELLKFSFKTHKILNNSNTSHTHFVQNKGRNNTQNNVQNSVKNKSVSDSKLMRMMNHSFVLYLEIFTWLPYGKANKYFKDIDDIYLRFQHPLNEVNRTLDEQLVNILNSVYNIPDENTYFEYLCKLRQKIMFMKKPKENINDYIISTGILEFLVVEDIKLIFPLKNTEILHTFYRLLKKNLKKMIPQHKIILSLYSDKLVSLLNLNFISKNHHKNLRKNQNQQNQQDESEISDHNDEEIEKKMRLLSLIDPLLLSIDLIKKYDIKLSVERLINSSGTVLEKNLPKLFDLYSFISDLDTILDKLMEISLKPNGKINYMELSNLQNHETYYSLWVIFYLFIKGIKSSPINTKKEFKNKLIKNYANIFKIFKAHLTCGSNDIIQMIMKCIVYLENSFQTDSKDGIDKYLLEMFDFLYNILFEYISERKNPFILQSLPSEALASTFTIIQFMKEMFNSSSGHFRTYLIKKASETQKQEDAIPIFAILNNSLEVMRPGVEINFTNESLEQITGTVLFYDQKEATVKIQLNESNKLPELKETETMYSNKSDVFSLNSLNFTVNPNFTDNMIFNTQSEYDIKLKRTERKNGKIEVDLSKCVNIWFSCPESVNIEIIQNYQPFLHLFFDIEITSNEDQTDTYFSSAFRLASLWDFISSTNFYDLLTIEQKLKIVHKRKWPDTFCPEQYIFDFGNYMSLRWIKFSPFTFVDVANSKNEVSRSPIVNNLVMSPKITDTGIMTTLFDGSTFVSPPIHPMNKMEIKIILHPTEPKNRFLRAHDKNALECDMRIRVFGLAIPFNTVLQSDDFEFECSTEGPSCNSSKFGDDLDSNETFDVKPLEIIIKFLPKKIGFEVYENGVLKSSTIGSPSIVMYFLTVELDCNNIAEYSVKNSNKRTTESRIKLSDAFAFKKTEKNDVFMRVTTKKVFTQMNDSSVYNELCLRDAACGLIDSFRTLISIHHIKKAKIYYPNSILRLLASIDPYPAGNAITLRDIRPFKHWKNTSEYIMDFITSYVDEIGPEILFKMKDEIDEMSHTNLNDDNNENKKESEGILCINNENKSALFIRKDQSILVSNCFVFSEDSTKPLKVIGYLKDDMPLYFSHDGVIVPFLRLSGSLVDYLLHMRHFMIISIHLNSYDFDFLTRKVRFLERSGRYFKKLFGHFVELLNSINPKPPMPGCFPYHLNLISFLISESSIHEFPEKFLLPTFCEFCGTKVELKETLPTSLNLNLNASNSEDNGDIYFAIHDNEVNSQRFEFIINSKITMKSNSFIILKSSDRSKKITIENKIANDKQPNNLEFVYCSLPDLTTITKELKNWKHHHSHQIQCFMKNSNDLMPSNYSTLPLSKQFSYDTIKFVFHILDSLKSEIKKEKKGFISFVNSHLIIHDPQDDNDRGQFKGELNKSGNIKNKPHNFEYFRKICDLSSWSPQRISYLKQRELSIFEVLDPNVLRISAEIQSYPEFENNFRKRLKEKPPLLVCTHNKAYHMLKSILKSAPAIICLQFIEFCTGFWGIEWINGQTHQIYVSFSESKEEIEAYQSDCILTIGVFLKKKNMKKALYSKLQEYSDRMFK